MYRYCVVLYCNECCCCRSCRSSVFSNENEDENENKNENDIFVFCSSRVRGEEMRFMGSYSVMNSFLDKEGRKERGQSKQRWWVVEWKVLDWEMGRGGRGREMLWSQLGDTINQLEKWWWSRKWREEKKANNCKKDSVSRIHTQQLRWWWWWCWWQR